MRKLVLSICIKFAGQMVFTALNAGDVMLGIRREDFIGANIVIFKFQLLLEQFSKALVSLCGFGSGQYGISQTRNTALAQWDYGMSWA